MMWTKYGNLGILGHSLRNKIPIVGNQGVSEAGSRDRFGWIWDWEMQTHLD